MLFIVATPIGHFQDITLRALAILKEVDGIICEGFRQASTLLKKIGISDQNLLLLDEHNEKTQSDEIIHMLASGKQLALISDCGTPAFQDPGSHLIAKCHEFGITVKSIPGPSSLMAALALSPSPIKEFHFAGFLPQKQQERISKLKALQRGKKPVILMDTPYRLKKLLTEINDYFGKHQPVGLAIDLTLSSEVFIHDKVESVIRQVGDRKGEFVLIIY